MKIKRTIYKVASDGFGRRLRLALISDLHSEDPRQVIDILAEESPDYILLAGDILESLDGQNDEKNEAAFAIFKECAGLAPTFYSTGNHEDGAVRSQSRRQRLRTKRERVYTNANIERIKNSGVTLLLDSYSIRDGIAFGGLMSGIISGKDLPNLDFLEEFSALRYPKILISHHPEYYPRHIKKLPVDIIVSGHAHGGQWRFFGRGIYAPGQGLLPKYTSGMYDGRLVVSRGLKQKGKIPRIFNPPQVVIIEIQNEKERG